jgi:Ni,Fe-hydrogenase III component G
MDRDPIAEIKDKFSDKIDKFQQRSERRIYFDVKKQDVPEVSKHIYELGARFVIASGTDTRFGIEILYHWSFDESGKVVSVRTLVDKESLEIESVAPILPAAEWIEREIHELLGVDFKNHPNLTRLLMAEDWPEGKYPLRREQ